LKSNVHNLFILKIFNIHIFKVYLFKISISSLFIKFLTLPLESPHVYQKGPFIGISYRSLDLQGTTCYYHSYRSPDLSGTTCYYHSYRSPSLTKYHLLPPQLSVILTYQASFVANYQPLKLSIASQQTS